LRKRIPGNNFIAGMNKRFFIFGLGIILGILANSCKKGSDATPASTPTVTMINYTMANGLAGNDVNAIALDAHGNIWFGTMNGISKFDGTTASGVFELKN
jgi:hypothetical protein